MNDKKIISLLQHTELFKFLPEKVLADLAKKTTVVDVEENKPIFLQGEIGNGLYIISSGVVAIVSNDKMIAELKEYDFFGELALIDNAPRSAAAITKTPCTLLFIDKETFNHIAGDMPVIFRAALEVVIRYLRQQMESPIETK